MVGISEVIECLEKEFDCASFSGEDHRHAAFQGAVCSSLRCCCLLWSCSSCCRCGSTTTTSSASSSTTATTTSMSSWLCLWLLRGLLDLSASSCLCNCCCCHGCFW